MHLKMKPAALFAFSLLTCMPLFGAETPWLRHGQKARLALEEKIEVLSYLTVEGDAGEDTEPSPLGILHFWHLLKKAGLEEPELAEQLEEAFDRLENTELFLQEWYSTREREPFHWKKRTDWKKTTARIARRSRIESFDPLLKHVPACRKAITESEEILRSKPDLCPPPMEVIACIYPAINRPVWSLTGLGFYPEEAFGQASPFLASLPIYRTSLQRPATSVPPLVAGWLRRYAPADFPSVLAPLIGKLYGRRGSFLFLPGSGCPPEYSMGGETHPLNAFPMLGFRGQQDLPGWPTLRCMPQILDRVYFFFPIGLDTRGNDLIYLFAETGELVDRMLVRFAQCDVAKKEVLNHIYFCFLISPPLFEVLATPEGYEGWKETLVTSASFRISHDVSVLLDPARIVCLLDGEGGARQQHNESLLANFPASPPKGVQRGTLGMQEPAQEAAAAEWSGEIALVLKNFAGTTDPELSQPAL